MLKRSRRLAPVLAVLALAGCGGGHHHAPHVAVKAPVASAHAPGFGIPPKNFQAGPTTTAPTITGYDSVTLSAVPANAQAVGGYVSGSWANYGDVVRDFPRAYHVSIATNAGVWAKCLDVEPGDAQPYQAGPWALGDIVHGHVYRPCVYSNLAEMPAVRASLASILPRSSYLLWVADWVNVPELLLGYDAQQWTDHAFGRNLDGDQFASYFFAGKPAPPKPKTVCFGPAYNPRHHAKVCNTIRPEVSRWSHARASSLAVEKWIDGVVKGYRCKKPYRRAVCFHGGRIDKTMRHRVAYFEAKVTAALKEYS